MPSVKIFPGKLKGVFTPPASKSVAHRAILCAALAEGESRLYPADLNQDVETTLRGARAIGARAEVDNGCIYVRGTAGRASSVRLNCARSASTLRLMLPVVAATSGSGYFSGAPELMRRPMKPYADMCARKGIRYAASEDGIKITGKLLPGEYEMPGDISAQFISGLLIALPLLGGDSELRIDCPPESEDCIHMTTDVLRAFRVNIQRMGGRDFVIPGNQYPTACDFEIEADDSLAAMYICMAALGHDVQIAALRRDSTQIDRRVIGALEKMGASFDWYKGKLRCLSRTTRGAEIDVSQMPDAAPFLALVCALTEDESRIVNAGRLRYKEIDRFEMIVDTLTALNAYVVPEGDAITIYGMNRLGTGDELSGRGDHRSVMMMAFAALACSSPLTITDCGCVDKSFPDFFRSFENMGARLVYR